MRSIRTLYMLTASLIICGYIYPEGPSNKGIKQSGDIILEENTNVQGAKEKAKAESVVSSIQRDPFYRVLEQLGINESRSITDYELSEFTLIGSVWDVPHPVVMFKGPKEKRYILKIGDKIGKHNGVVVYIGKGETHIDEVYVDIDKNRIKKSTIKKVEKGA